MTDQDLEYLGGTDGHATPLGRCSGAMARAQALICLMLSEQDNLRQFGGGLHTLIGMTNADESVLIPSVSLEVSRAVDYLNTVNVPDYIEAAVDEVTVSEGGLSLKLTVTFNGDSAQINTTL